MGRSLIFEFNESGKYLVKVYDLVGRNILVTEVEKTQRVISINDKFQSGIYYLSVMNFRTKDIQIIKLIIAE
jgi:hypothetical protein